MRGMVKFNDLEDLVEPALNGGPEASPLVTRQHEGTSSEAGIVRGSRAPNNFSYGQEDINNDLA